MPDAYPSVRLLLVRHAHVDPAAPLGEPTPLDELGREQARRLGETLRGASVDRVLSSPFRRALETAELLGAALGLEAEPEPLLLEFQLGVEGSSSYEQAQAARPDLAFWRAEHRATAEAESLGEFQGRVSGLLGAIALQARPGETYALVTHAGVIDAALRWAFGLTSTSGWMIETIAPHASVTELAHWPRGRHELGAPRYSVLRRLGDVEALPPELRSD